MMTSMKGITQSTLQQAEALDEQLRRVVCTLGQYDGDHLTEAKTEQQLDRWTQGRDLDSSMVAAVEHMAKVIAELRNILDGIEG